MESVSKKQAEKQASVLSHLAFFWVPKAKVC